MAQLSVGMQFEEARAVASQYGKYAGEIQQLITSLKTSQGQLSANWEGRGFDEFQQRFDELIPDVEEFRELLERIKSFLNSAADAMEETDERIAKGASR